MKKLIKYFLIIIIVIIAIPNKKSDLIYLLDNFNITNATNTYYTTDCEHIENAKITECGSAVFVQSNIKNCLSVKKQLSVINGQSVSFSGDYNLYNKLVGSLMGEIVLSEQVGNVKCCYGYNNKLSDYITIDGKQVNVQIAINNSTITIGTPVILGSY